jgi:transglutaminase-like putative cysteine protease
LRKLLYTVVSRLPYPRLTSVELPHLNARYLQLPRTLSPRVRALAEGWRREAKNGSFDIMAAGLDYFRSGNFAYTLSPGTYVGAEPLEDFLFNRKRGHCEYFASALALMLRAVEIPSRLVTGFKGADPLASAGHYEVQQRHAHAWVEAYVQDLGWVGFDAANCICPTAAYIRTSIGLDYSSAMPVRGIRRGESAEDLTVRVSVTAGAGDQ